MGPIFHQPQYPGGSWTLSRPSTAAPSWWGQKTGLPVVLFGPSCQQPLRHKKLSFRVIVGQKLVCCTQITSQVNQEFPTSFFAIAARAQYHHRPPSANRSLAGSNVSEHMGTL